MKGEMIVQAGPTDRRRRFLVISQGPLPTAFSGITWHCARAAMAESVVEGAVALAVPAKVNVQLHSRAALWKMKQLLLGRKQGGYTLHPTYNDVLWKQHLPSMANTVIINNGQLFGNFFARHYEAYEVTPCFFIDATLSEWLYGYGAVEELNFAGDLVERAIELEREGYQCAKHILAMSRVTARTLTECYGVPSDRISLVLPGANIDDDAVPAPSEHEGWVGKEFTLGFVGLYPFRKGLDKLAEAVRLLRTRGKPIRLRAIGRCPDSIAAMDGIDFLGTISKTQDTARFVEAIRSVDLGCQLSRAESTGIALLEFMRVGVPVLATDLGFVPDLLADGGGLAVPPDITGEQLADVLDSLMTDYGRYQALRQAAVHRSAWASWRRAAREMDKVLARFH
jgi:glycosyltransferase involved in cell wall biosynthesis